MKNKKDKNRKEFQHDIERDDNKDVSIRTLKIEREIEISNAMVS